MLRELNGGRRFASPSPSAPFAHQHPIPLHSIPSPSTISGLRARELHSIHGLQSRRSHSPLAARDYAGVHQHRPITIIIIVLSSGSENTHHSPAPSLASRAGECECRRLAESWLRAERGFHQTGCPRYFNGRGTRSCHEE